MIDFLSQPWPWYVAGPIIGLMVPLLLVLSGKNFGVSSSLRHTCAATLPGRAEYFRYDWRSEGLWNMVFVLGILIGGFVAATFLENPDPIAISAAAHDHLAALGVEDFQGLVPDDVFRWSNVLTPQGLVVLVLGGFLLGFGARYAGGCTSGHGIMGLATLQLPSFIAVVGFFVGGLFITWLVLPLLL